MKKTILVSGSCGLIGSEVVLHFASLGYVVYGIDSNQRAVFFGPDGDNTWVQRNLCTKVASYHHLTTDIRDRSRVLEDVKAIRPSAIVHAAAQPSHDRAAAIPFDDFDTNAVGTLNLLQAARQYCPEAPFVHMSTNKVYGDRPNSIPLAEGATRWDFDSPEFTNGIAESLSIDQSTHSLFGASKVAADVLVQEYGRYFDMPTCCLRGGCLTGPNHAGVELHGFLSYLVKCNLRQLTYSVFGYKGKQVRDNIHSYDVAEFIRCFIERPRKGEVYNLGGGRGNSCSILEAFQFVERLTGLRQKWTYVDANRVGDHICYYSDLRKLQEHYPEWLLSRSLEVVFQELVMSWRARLNTVEVTRATKGVSASA